MLEATARAEDRHFWFLGLRRHARSCSTPRSAAARCASSSIAARAPAAISTGCSEYGLAVGVERSPVGLRLGRARRSRLVHGTVTALPFADRVGRSRHVVRRAVLPRRRERGAGHRRDVAGAETGRHRARQRRGPRHPPGRAFDADARSPALHADAAWAPGSNRPDSGSSGMTFTNMMTFPITLAVRLADRLTGRDARRLGRRIHRPARPSQRHPRRRPRRRGRPGEVRQSAGGVVDHGGREKPK